MQPGAEAYYPLSVCRTESLSLTMLSRIMSFTVFPTGISLQVRVTLVMGLVVGLSVATTNLLLVRMISNRIDSTIQQRSLEVAIRVQSHFAHASTVSQDADDLARTLETICRGEPRLTFLEVFDADGKPIAHHVLNQHDWKIFTLHNSMTVNPHRHQTPLRQDDLPQTMDNAVDAASMVSFRPIRFTSNPPHSPVVLNSRNVDPNFGLVAIGTADQVLTTLRSNISHLGWLVSLIVVSATVPTIFFLMRRLTRAIRRIARAAEDMSAGAIPRILRINRKDEIGQLASSFNQMTQRLCATHQKLLQSNANLESMVDHRTSQLQTVNDLLEKEIETKNEFIRTVTHDLNAPLRNIAGMARLIRKRHADTLPAEVSNRIERIEANVAMETAMLDDLLEISKLRTRPYKTIDVDLNVMLKQIREALDEEITERGIVVDIDTDFPVVHIEPRLVRQVFLNLLDNAIKYMGDNSHGRISVFQTVEDQWLVITVEDNGIGIPDDARERVFDLFCRGASIEVTPPDESASPAPAGRGVGLASVRAVVERWGGTIVLESEVGKGTKFQIRIPGKRIVDSGSADTHIIAA